MGGLATGIKLHQPHEGRVNQRVVWVLTGEKIIGVGRQIEISSGAVTLGQLEQQLSATSRVQTFDDLRDLSSPGGVAFGAFQKLAQMASPGG
jgi:hypothetical protein